MKREYMIEIERDGRWWMVHIPELEGLTQARRLSEAELMAREWIAVSTGTPIADVAVHVTSITVPDMGNVQRSAEELIFMRDEAAQAVKKAQNMAAGFVRELTAAGIPVRDAGELLHLSPQRISQLANT
ncbi:HicB family toxin-antitoxin system [Mycobacterium helveticum]|uniref:HicB family toxin-antitoxin system n=1 Tax=Mycobacterium helveticum TaxID=2592811 RepID=A0A557XYL9_9MYCO|nr:HicB family toxin-antitoxin system [Mycobacterium helveticum]TVS86672.1 HicB family toxin-antitoxin system [Mycobacterium helveticum]TVS91261.1 HicB family toxin-antitoxin system [Mycobacterium helveticum]